MPTGGLIWPAGLEAQEECYPQTGPASRAGPGRTLELQPGLGLGLGFGSQWPAVSHGHSPLKKASLGSPSAPVGQLAEALQEGDTCSWIPPHKRTSCSPTDPHQSHDFRSTHRPPGVQTPGPAAPALCHDRDPLTCAWILILWLLSVPRSASLCQRPFLCFPCQLPLGCQAHGWGPGPHRREPAVGGASARAGLGSCQH